MVNTYVVNGSVKFKFFPVLAIATAWYSIVSQLSTVFSAMSSSFKNLFVPMVLVALVVVFWLPLRLPIDGSSSE